jgi:hypothetical protein
MVRSERNALAASRSPVGGLWLEGGRDGPGSAAGASVGERVLARVAMGGLGAVGGKPTAFTHSAVSSK